MAKKDLKKLLDDEYSDSELANAVAKDIQDNVTTDGILSGQLVLPNEENARQWYERKQNKK